MRACCCVNQCKTCGQCCQVQCGHRVGMGTYTAPNTPQPYAAPAGSTPLPWRSGEVRVIPPQLTEDDIRRIIREELGRSS